MFIHEETKIFPFSQEQLFKLIADVKAYPTYLPWIVQTRINDHRQEEVGNSFHAEVDIGYKVFKYAYGCRVHLFPNTRIQVHYEKGPFEKLSNYWVFTAITPLLTKIDFHMSFKFKTGNLENLLTPLFSEAVQRMTSAFEERAHSLYSPHRS